MWARYYTGVFLPPSVLLFVLKEPVLQQSRSHLFRFSRIAPARPPLGVPSCFILTLAIVYTFEYYNMTVKPARISPDKLVLVGKQKKFRSLDSFIFTINNINDTVIRYNRFNK